MLERLESLFYEQFDTKPTLLVRAPGRINLIGEHTDYNNGLVFPAAIDKSMYFAFRENNSNRYNLVAHDKSSSISVSMHDLDTDKLWGKYCIGVIQEFDKLGFTPQGFDCLFLSEIPIGAGVSSSAALECGLAKGLDAMIKSGLDNWELVRLGNRSENNFLGIQSGILDQFSSIFGKEGQAMLMDCNSQSFEYYPVDLHPYSLVLINTNVKHSHLTSGYNDRPTECKEIVTIARNHNINLDNLSQLSNAQLLSLQDKMSDIHYRRAQFILDENQRVIEFKEALLSKNFQKLGDLLYASHHGLQHLYEVSCMELDLLIELSRQEQSIIGARMMGGGFGGCTLNLILSKDKANVIDNITKAYYQQTGIEATSYYINIGNGVELVNNRNI